MSRDYTKVELSSACRTFSFTALEIPTYNKQIPLISHITNAFLQNTDKKADAPLKISLPTFEYYLQNIKTNIWL